MKITLSAVIRSLTLSGVLLLMSVGAYANHILGMDLSYAYVSGSTYNVTLIAWGDCGDVSGAFPYLSTSSPTICVYDGPTYITSFTLTVQTPSSGVFSAPVCAADSSLT